MDHTSSVVLFLYVVFFDFNVIISIEFSLCDRRKIKKSDESSVRTRKCVMFFYEYFLAFEPVDIDVRGFCFLLIFTNCYHQVT